MAVRKVVRGMSQTDLAAALPKLTGPRRSAFDVDQDNSTIMRAGLLAYSLEGLLARMEFTGADEELKGIITPLWLLADELHRDLQELRKTETPPGRESAPGRE